MNIQQNELTKLRDIFRLEDLIDQSSVGHSILIIDAILEVIVSIYQITSAMDTERANKREENDTHSELVCRKRVVG